MNSVASLLTPNHPITIREIEIFSEIPFSYGSLAIFLERVAVYKGVIALPRLFLGQTTMPPFIQDGIQDQLK